MNEKHGSKQKEGGRVVAVATKMRGRAGLNSREETTMSKPTPFLLPSELVHLICSLKINNNIEGRTGARLATCCCRWRPTATPAHRFDPSARFLPRRPAAAGTLRRDLGRPRPSALRESLLTMPTVLVLFLWNSFLHFCCFCYGILCLLV